MSERLHEWMDRYVLAWSTNDPEQIATLFSEGAVYDPQTAGGEWHGVEEIVEQWIEIGDEEDNWEFEWRPLVESDDLAIVVGKTHYFEPAMSYRNLFVIRFDEEDRCYDFTEWYIEEDPG